MTKDPDIINSWYGTITNINRLDALLITLLITIMIKALCTKL